MVRFTCDWCRRDIKGKPARYARHHFCLDVDCKNKYRQFIEGKVEIECEAAFSQTNHAFAA